MATKNQHSKREIQRHIKMYEVMLNTLKVCGDMVEDHKKNAEDYLRELEGQVPIENQNDK